MQIATLGPGDDAVDVGTNLLSAGFNGLNAIIGEQRLHQGLLHGLSMAGIGAQLAALLVMPHRVVS